MIRLILATLVFVATANAAPAPLTINKCMEIASGLKALDYVGAQLNETGQPPQGAKQYKMSAQLRWTVASNLAALKSVTESFEKTRNGLITEIGGGEGIKPGSPEMSRLLTELQKILDKPCDVIPGRIKLDDLKLGDGDGQNAIPPGVLSALSAIIDP